MASLAQSGRLSETLKERDMAKGDHEFGRRAKGATGGGYTRPRVQIGFDKETIDKITKWAKFNNRSFAAEVRALVSVGLSTRTR